MLTAQTRSQEELRVTIPLCDDRKVSKPRPAPVKGQGFKKAAYPVE